MGTGFSRTSVVARTTTWHWTSMAEPRLIIARRVNTFRSRVHAAIWWRTSRAKNHRQRNRGTAWCSRSISSSMWFAAASSARPHSSGEVRPPALSALTDSACSAVSFALPESRNSASCSRPGQPRTSARSLIVLAARRQQRERGAHPGEVSPERSGEFASVVGLDLHSSTHGFAAG